MLLNIKCYIKIVIIIEKKIHYLAKIFACYGKIIIKLFLKKNFKSLWNCKLIKIFPQNLT